MKLPEKTSMWVVVVAVTGLAGLSVGILAGWKASIVEDAEWHQRVQTHMEQTDPLKAQFAEEMTINAVQQARLDALDHAVTALVEAQRETNRRLQELIPILAQRAAAR